MLVILIILSVNSKNFPVNFAFLSRRFLNMFKFEAFFVLVIRVFQSCADLLLNTFFSFVSVTMSDEKIYFGMSSFL